MLVMLSPIINSVSAAHSLKDQSPMLVTRYSVPLWITVSGNSSLPVGAVTYPLTFTVLAVPSVTSYFRLSTVNVCAHALTVASRARINVDNDFFIMS